VSLHRLDARQVPLHDLLALAVVVEGEGAALWTVGSLAGRLVGRMGGWIWEKTYGVGFVLIFPPPGPPKVDIVAEFIYLQQGK
jgi:hypothetical protein